MKTIILLRFLQYEKRIVLNKKCLCTFLSIQHFHRYEFKLKRMKFSLFYHNFFFFFLNLCLFFSFSSSPCFVMYNFDSLLLLALLLVICYRMFFFFSYILHSTFFSHGGNMALFYHILMKSPCFIA